MTNSKHTVPIVSVFNITDKNYYLINSIYHIKLDKFSTTLYINNFQQVSIFLFIHHSEMKLQFIFNDFSEFIDKFSYNLHSPF